LCFPALIRDPISFGYLNSQGQCTGGRDRRREDISWGEGKGRGGGLSVGEYQPEVSAQDIGQHVVDLHRQLPGGHQHQRKRAVPPVQTGLLTLQPRGAFRHCEPPTSTHASVFQHLCRHQHIGTLLPRTVRLSLNENAVMEAPPPPRDVSMSAKIRCAFNLQYGFLPLQNRQGSSPSPSSWP